MCVLCHNLLQSSHLICGVCSQCSGETCRHTCKPKATLSTGDISLESGETWFKLSIISDRKGFCCAERSTTASIWTERHLRWLTHLFNIPWLQVIRLLSIFPLPFISFPSIPSGRNRKVSTYSTSMSRIRQPAAGLSQVPLCHSNETRRNRRWKITALFSLSLSLLCGAHHLSEQWGRGRLGKASNSWKEVAA